MYLTKVSYLVKEGSYEHVRIANSLISLDKK